MRDGSDEDRKARHAGAIARIERHAQATRLSAVQGHIPERRLRRADLSPLQGLIFLAQLGCRQFEHLARPLTRPDIGRLCLTGRCLCPRGARRVQATRTVSRKGVRRASAEFQITESGCADVRSRTVFRLFPDTSSRGVGGRGGFRGLLLPRVKFLRAASSAGVLMILGLVSFAVIPGMPPVLDPTVSPRI